MVEIIERRSGGTPTPWHVWAVGALSLLWYFSGAVTIMLAQHATLPGLTNEEYAYYAAKSDWLEVAADAAALCGITGSLGLLFRRAWAEVAFALLTLLVVAQDVAEYALGTSRALVDQAAMFATVAIFAIALFNWIHARLMRKRGVLREAGMAA